MAMTMRRLVVAKRGTPRAEVPVAPNSTYIVLPPGCFQSMPPDLEWWAPYHSHVVGGCEVVVFVPKLCPVCRTCTHAPGCRTVAECVKKDGE